MRLLSFALTTPQFLDGSKDVTRRMGWLKAKAGDELCAVKKCMGFRPGESVERLGVIRLVSVRRESLRAMLDDLEYGFDETRREVSPRGTRITRRTYSSRSSVARTKDAGRTAWLRGWNSSGSAAATGGAES